MTGGKNEVGEREDNNNHRLLNLPVSLLSLRVDLLELNRYFLANQLTSFQDMAEIGNRFLESIVQGDFG